MISIIVAMDRNRVIGFQGKIPWRLPADLKRFRQLTMGHAVIMGRKTFQSIGGPLPGRTNIVVTRQKEFRAEGCTVVHSLQEALQVAGPDPFVIGGAELYAQALPLADRLYITEVDTCAPRGDAYFPEIDPAQWQPVEEQSGEDNNLRYRWRTYVRRAVSEL